MDLVAPPGDTVLVRDPPKLARGSQRFGFAAQPQHALVGLGGSRALAEAVVPPKSTQRRPG